LWDGERDDTCKFIVNTPDQKQTEVSGQRKDERRPGQNGIDKLRFSADVSEFITIDHNFFRF